MLVARWLSCLYHGQSLALEIFLRIQRASVSGLLPGASGVMPSCTRSLFWRMKAFLWPLFHSSWKCLLLSVSGASHGPGLPGKPLSQDPLLPKLVPISFPRGLSIWESSSWVGMNGRNAILEGMTETTQSSTPRGGMNLWVRWVLAGRRGQVEPLGHILVIPYPLPHRCPQRHAEVFSLLIPGRDEGWHQGWDASLDRKDQGGVRFTQWSCGSFNVSLSKNLAVKKKNH